MLHTLGTYISIIAMCYELLLQYACIFIMLLLVINAKYLDIALINHVYILRMK